MVESQSNMVESQSCTQRVCVHVHGYIAALHRPPAAEMYWKAGMIDPPSHPIFPSGPEQSTICCLDSSYSTPDEIWAALSTAPEDANA